MRSGGEGQKNMKRDSSEKRRYVAEATEVWMRELVEKGEERRRKV